METIPPLTVAAVRALLGGLLLLAVLGRRAHLLVEAGAAIPDAVRSRCAVVAVPDTTQALGALAAGYRSTFSGPLVAPPSLQARISRKVHGLAGTFDLPLSAVAGNPSTEPRAGGAGSFA